MNKKKTLCALAVAAIMCLSSVSALANTWQLKDYDTSSEALEQSMMQDKVAKIYAEYDDAGMPTGRVLSGDSVEANQIKDAYGNPLTGWAQASLLDKWIDKAYPNYSYVRLYADGNYTGVVFPTGAYGDCEYRWSNYMWDSSTHDIYQVLQAKLPNGWYGGQDGAVPLYPTRNSGKKANVRVIRNQIGVDWSGIPAVVQVETGMPEAFEEVIPRVYQETTYGPVFNFDGSISSGNEFALAAPARVYNGGDFAATTWVDAGFELEEPYRIYQILSADGYLADGTMGKPYIYRYTGGLASPNVTWVPCGFTTGNELVVEKYVDGIKTGYTKNSGVYGKIDYSVTVDNAAAMKYLNGRCIAAYYDGTRYIGLPAEVFVQWSELISAKTDVGIPLAVYVN